MISPKNAPNSKEIITGRKYDVPLNRIGKLRRDGFVRDVEMVDSTTTTKKHTLLGGGSSNAEPQTL